MSVSQADVDVLNLDALRPGYTADPYPILAELREAAPVRQVEVLGLRAWLVTRYSDVLEVFRHPSVSTEARYANPAAQAWPQVAASLRGPLSRSVAMSDDPDHAPATPADKQGVHPAPGRGVAAANQRYL
jgi:cytochrome P450